MHERRTTTAAQERKRSATGRQELREPKTSPLHPLTPTKPGKLNTTQKSGDGATTSDGDAEAQPHGNQAKKRKAVFYTKSSFCTRQGL